MATATMWYNIVDKNGTRVQTYKNGNPPTVISGVIRSVQYMAKSQSLTGDHRKPTAWYFRKTRSSSAKMEVVQTLKTSTYDRETGYYSSSCDTDPESLPSFLSWQQAAAYNDAVNDLGANLRGTTDLSINLFQWKQLQKSVTRLRNMTLSFQKTVSRVKQGVGPGSKELSGLYLEWTYGLKPVIQDCYNVFIKLMTEAKSGRPLLHYRGRGKSVERYTLSENLTAFAVARCPATVKGERSYRCQLDIYIKPDLTTLQKISGYTSLDPLAWAWEMMPYSFVVDWFWNFGGYLRALETALLYQSQFSSGCRTDTVLHDRSLGGGGVSSTHPSMTYQVSGGSKVYKMYDRTVLQSIPVPGRPRLKTSLSPWRVVNAVALLLQLQGDPRKPRTSIIRR